MPTKPRPTLQSLARLAGVSPSTVSRALRGHPLLKPETVARIRALAERVGYQANPLISDVMRRVRKQGGLRGLGTLAYLTFHDTPEGWRANATYRAFHAGAVRRAQELGFALETHWARQPHLSARRLTEILLARGITGVVIGPRPKQLAVDLLDWEHFSAAVVGVPIPGLSHHRAGSFQGHNMAVLLSALATRGYRRPGLALLEVQAGSSDPGWLAAWALHQQQQPARLRVPLLVLPQLAPPLFQTWFREHEPDVVIGLEDDFVAWLRQLGRRVPDDVGYARLSRPATGRSPAGIHQFPEEIGAAAIELVTSQIFSGHRGRPTTARALLIEGEWRDGWSLRSAGG
jgi:DNA-binding LacI/PurR family transcriptional regulator